MRDPIWHYKFQVTKDKDFLLYQLRKLDTFGIFVAFLDKRDGYGDVLFAFLDVKPYLKKESTLTRKKKKKKKKKKKRANLLPFVTELAPRKGYQFLLNERWKCLRSRSSLVSYCIHA